MKEREPDFEDDKVRIQRVQPQAPEWQDMDKDPTVIAINEETEEIFESRVYKLKTDPKTFTLVLDVLCQRTDRHGVGLGQAVDSAADIVDETSIKFLAKRRKEDGRITYLLVGISPESRWVLDRRDLVSEAEYCTTVETFEGLPLFKAILSPPLVVALDEWRRYVERGAFSAEDAERGVRPLDPDDDTRTHHPPR